MGHSLGDVLDGVATVVDPAAPALIHGDRTITWAEFDARSNNLAREIRARGIETGDRNAVYMRNCPEYCEAISAAFKSRCISSIVKALRFFLNSVCLISL